MKKLFLIVIFPVLVYSQGSVAGKFSPDLNGWLANRSNTGFVKVWVDLVDKGENLSMLSNPESFLSKRSIERRALRGDAINETDLPLWGGYLQELEGSGIRIISKSKWFNSVTVNADRNMLIQLAEKNFVKKISPVAKGRTASKVYKENDNSFVTGNSFIEATNALDYGESLAQLAPQQIPAAHNMGYDGSGIFICLMDAGFNNLAHEVYDSLRIVSTWDFVNNDPDVGDGGMGNGSHGTSTLSVIGGFKPGKLIGTAYRANYLLAKTENTDSETPAEEDFWIAAAEWADSIGVDVTSTSLVYLDFDPPFTSYTWQDMNGNTARITKGADLAVAKGIVVFNSAGNNGFHATQNTLAAPADGDSVISIGSITAQGARSGFSSVGLTFDGRIKPDMMAVGSSVYAAAPGGRTSYTYTSGTSLACPIAAGIAALMLQKNPNLNPIEIRQILRNTASQPNSPDRLMGWGIMNAVAAIDNVPSGVEDGNTTVPSDIILLGNYPNPFNPVTTVQFTLPTERFLSLKLYNSSGELVKIVAEGTYSAGTGKIVLDASGLPSGNYFLLLNDGNRIYTQKLSLLK